MKETHHLGSLSPEYALLGFLAEQPNHGYELHNRLVSELGQVWHVSQSQVYSILKRLEKRGDIAGTVQEQEKLPNRMLFQLTPSGQARLADWLNAPTGCSVRAVRVEFITRLYFAHRRSRASANALIDSQFKDTREGLARLQAMLADLPAEQPFSRLGLELRINQLTSLLDWLETCRTAVNHEIEPLKQDQL